VSYYDDASLVLIPSGVKTSKVYSQKPTNGTGDLTFSRASTATRTNASGVIESVASNVPRLDYSGGATCPSLLLEGQRTNLVLQSQSFNTSPWFNSGTLSGTSTTVTNNVSGVIAPDGTQTASLVVMTRPATSNLTYLSQIQSLATTGTYKGSVYIKAKDATQVGKTIRVWQWDGLERNTRTVTLTLNWQRVETEITSTLPSGSRELLAMGFRSGQGTDLSAEFHVWGAQGELGSFVSSYIPTTTAAVTRLKDDVAISGASALIGQTEGTVFIDVDFRVVSGGGIRVFFNLEGSVSNQFTGITIQTTNDGNNVQGAGTVYAITQGRHKIVFRYNSATNVSKLFVDGAQRGASTFAAFSATIDRIVVLGRANPFNAFAVDRQQFGGCNQFAIWKTALSDAQCIQLSTL